MRLLEVLTLPDHPLHGQRLNSDPLGFAAHLPSGVSPASPVVLQPVE